MLKKFSVKNFKNFRNKIVFDLSTSKKYEFNTECVKNDIVAKSLIYGPNASGKSNLGFAIMDIVSHLTDNQKNSDYYDDYIHGERTSDQADFYYEFIFNGNTLEYSYGKSSLEDLTYEQIEINKKRVIYYDRDDTEGAVFELAGSETLRSDLGQSKISVVKYLMRNSILNESEENDTMIAFFKFVNKMLFFRCLDGNNYIGYEVGAKSLSEDIIKRNAIGDFEKFLNSAGINYKLVAMELNGKETIAVDYGKEKLDLFAIASTGTKALTLFYYWLLRLRDDHDVSFVYIDEFDAFYHYRLSRIIVDELKKINNLQVILTSHNTTLISNDILRPDCYFILDKSEIKPLWSFTSKELRKAHNIEKMYKAGAFDA